MRDCISTSGYMQTMEIILLGRKYHFCFNYNKTSLPATSVGYKKKVIYTSTSYILLKDVKNQMYMKLMTDMLTSSDCYSNSSTVLFCYDNKIILFNF